MRDTTHYDAPPAHGGRLRAAARQHGIALERWIDLSTGISPHAYPVPAIPAAAWHRLPEEHDGLEQAAAAYFGSDAVLPVAGSQAAIQALPAVIAGRTVSLLSPTYGEHPHAWRHRCVRTCTPDNLNQAAQHSDIVVIVNPNNPTGVHVEPAQLLALHRDLARRGGWLIVDEAFIDAQPALSLAHAAGRENLVILRSLGKFFGLAGARVGFVLGPQSLRDKLAHHLGPWPISGPARHVACAALADRTWQAMARNRIAADGERLATLLAGSGLGQSSGTPLFQWIQTPHARTLYDHFTARGILTRHFELPPSLRLGLPAHETAWQRLADALACIPAHLLANPSPNARHPQDASL